MYTALTIAGSDSCGGAGIQADLKTMTAHAVYGMSAITALTAQNTTGVTDIFNVTADFLKAQLDAIFTDIYPDAVKIGMLSNSELTIAVIDSLKKYSARNVVVDPVMVATSGANLLSDDSKSIMLEALFPLADIITPNIPETEALAGMSIRDEKDMEKAGIYLYEIIKKQIDNDGDCAVLIKGGHSINDANDLLISKGKIIWIEGKRVDNPNTHGTGCTLSSAIASNLARGIDVEQSVRNAKDYISGALASMMDLGKGSGPLNHMWNII